MNVNKKQALTLIACLLVAFIKAQTSLNIYPINQAIGIKFFSDKKVSLEPRIDLQFDVANGENNIFVNTQLYTTINFLREEKFNMYSGIGLGANIYNQAQSNFTGSIPIGAKYYIDDNKRFALIAECGLKTTIADFVKIKSFALFGIQIRLSKLK